MNTITWARNCLIQWTILAFLVLPQLTGLFGQGVLLIESDSRDGLRLPRPSLPPHPTPRPEVHQLYRIASLDIQATVRAGVVQVTVNQGFENRSGVVSEASAVFPLPYDAAVSGMTFLVDGKEIPGKLLNADEARRIYESYVRRSQDPALVQWIGTGMLKTNVFPIPPGATRVVTIQYSQVAQYRDGQIDLKLPLGAAGFTSEAIGNAKISVRINGDKGLGNIYSPTHSVNIQRSPDNTASVSMEIRDYIPKGDFRLLIEDRKGEVSASLISYRPNESEDGYFLLMVHPDFPVTKQEEASKNIVLVLDKSGSMRGEKMEQARNALLYVLKNLPANDHFSLIVYDGQVQSFRETLVPATQENRDSAMAFVRQLEAAGSTNIDLALETAFRTLRDNDRPSYIVFLSDGEPTVGERDPRRIVTNAISANKQRARVLSFGVGHDVNSRLLDHLSRDCFGQTFLVAPQEDIEDSVSKLYTRIGQVALADVRWQALSSDGGVFDGVRQVYPSKIQDLFSGDQVTLLGRYKRSFAGKLQIEGTLGKQALKFEQDAKLESSTGSEHSYIAALWATRRVGAIIDEIDLEGSKAELVRELVELSQRYGIITPYTAFLAEEPNARFAGGANEERARDNLLRLEKQSGADAFAQRGLKSMQGRAGNLADAQAAQSLAESSAPMGGGLGNSSSGGAGFAGPASQSRPGSAGAPAGVDPERKKQATKVRQAADRAFFWQEDKWVDSTASEEQLKKVEIIERFSEKYFQLVNKHRAILQPLLDEEAPIQVRIENQVYQL
jgi:Ca-activated chloride channel homolog